MLAHKPSKISGFCFLVFVCVCFAQTPTTGKIVGAVTDPSQAAIVGATVSVEGSAGFLRNAATDGDGRFAFLFVAPGVYSVHVGKSGFANSVVEDIVVRITETADVPVQMRLAERKDYVNVVSEPPFVQAKAATRGDVVSGGALRQLPLVTNNFQQLLALTPGTASAINNSSQLGRGDSVFNVNGQRALSNAVIINGVDASSIGTGSTPNLAVPAADSLGEFIVQTSLYDASQGRNAGSVVAAVTKSGTNNFHGSLYEFLRNTDLDANNFFLNRAGIARPPYQRNLFGGTLGGPVLKNRVWFFASYQGTREVNGTSLDNSIGTVFVPEALSNDRSVSTLNALAAGYGVPPCTNGLAVPGCFGQTALTLLKATLPNGQFVVPSPPHPVPLPSLGGQIASVPTPVVAISRFREDQFNSNLDFQVSAANNASIKLFWAQNPEVQGLYNSFGTGNALPVPGFGADVDFDQKLFAFGDTHAFSATLVNDLRFGYSNINTKSIPQQPFSAAQLGIVSPLSSLFPGMPEISVANYFDLGASPFSDNHAAEMNYTALDTLAWIRGRHSLKFGLAYEHHDVATNFNLYTSGQIFFLGVSGDSFKDFLSGFSGLSILGSGVNNRNALSYDWAGFTTDEWQVTKGLTLTLGIRYEYFSPYIEAQGRYVGFDPGRLRTATIPALPAGYNMAVKGGFVQADNAAHPIPGIPLVQSSLVPPDKNNFAPRIGFAWQLFSRKGNPFVVRGGYGIYYDKPNSRYINYQLLDFPYYTLAQAVATPVSAPFPQVLQPGSYPLAFNNPVIFPYGGPPAFFPGAAAGKVQLVSASGIFPDIHDFRTPYVQQYSFGIQNAFARNWMWDVSYVGSAGRKLFRLLSLNQTAAPSAASAGLLSLALSSLAVQGFGFDLMQSSANSSYNSFQASLTKRLSNGLQFIAAYTLSHSIDDYSGDLSGTSDVTVVPGNQAFLDNRGSLTSIGGIALSSVAFTIYPGFTLAHPALLGRS